MTNVVAQNAGVRSIVDGVDDQAGYFDNASFSSVAPDVVLGGDGFNDEGNLWSDPAGPSSDIYIRSHDEVWIELDENDDEASQFRVRNGTNTTAFSVDESGNTVATGTKSAAVRMSSGEFRKVYAVESPIVVFEDFGSDRTQNGVATVQIDPLYSETVNLVDADYQVFLTPVGGPALLYVANKGPTSFEVRDGQGASIIDFDYRIVARRKGYERVRLESAPIENVEGNQLAAGETDDS
jgi:hypothetical protein